MAENSEVSLKEAALAYREANKKVACLNNCLEIQLQAIQMTREQLHEAEEKERVARSRFLKMAFTLPG